MRCTLSIVSSCLALALALPAFAVDNTSQPRAGRYALVNPMATPEQSDLLSVVIDISFASSITTVGEALTHLLVRSGYSLANLDSSDPYLPILFSRPLPQVHRKLGPIKLETALKTLAGPAWILSVDPVNRFISYELLAKFRPTIAISDVSHTD